MRPSDSESPTLHSGGPMRNAGVGSTGRLRSMVLASLTLVAFFYVFPYYPQINNPNENVRLYMTAAIVEHGSYEITPLRQRWGWTNDAGKVGNEYYSVKAPGTTFLGVPGYAAYYAYTQATGTELDRTVALYICRVTASVLPTLVFLLFFYRFLGRFTRFAFVRDGVFLSVALGSLLYGYGLLFVSHTLSAATAFGAFMMLLRASPRTSASRAFLIGLLASSVTLFEYPGFFVSVVLSVYAAYLFRLSRPLLGYCLGALIPVVLMMHFQYEAFGNPFSPGHLHVETDAFRAAHEEGFYGADVFHWDGAFNMLFSPSVGLFLLTPILFFSVPGAIDAVRKSRSRLPFTLRRGALPSILSFLFTYVLICLMNNWRAGWSVGPRYLAVTVPFVAFLAIPLLNKFAERAPRLTAVMMTGSTLVAFVASGIASAYYPHIPVAFGNPLRDFFPLLLEHGYAPNNLGHLAGLQGTSSMIPWFVALLVLGVMVGWVRRFDWRERAAIAALGVALATVSTFGLLRLMADEAVPKPALANVTRTWSPKGHDVAARLETESTSRPLTPQEWTRLIAVYEDEGRMPEARRARARSVAAPRPSRDSPGD